MVRTDEGAEKIENLDSAVVFGTELGHSTAEMQAFGGGGDIVAGQVIRKRRRGKMP